MDERQNTLQEGQSPIGRIALVWRGAPDTVAPTPGATRFHLIFSALDADPVQFVQLAIQRGDARRSLSP